MSTSYRPEGYHTVTPYLMINGAAKFIAFVQEAFDATLDFRMDGPGGQIAHSTVRIGDSKIELADASEQWPARSIGMHIYVPDVDATFAKAVAAGATVVTPVKDEFYGDRTGNVRDPFGNDWFIATVKEVVEVEELEKRAAVTVGGEHKVKN